jgi:hypothetical protein
VERALLIALRPASRFSHGVNDQRNFGRRQAAKAIKAEQDERRKQKSPGRVAKMMAQKADDLDRMPLSGKAALDAIRS